MTKTKQFPWDQRVAKAFEFRGETPPERVGTGHIHTTWRVESARGTLLLQRFNTDVFPDPNAVAENLLRASTKLLSLRSIGAYAQDVLEPVLASNSPDAPATATATATASLHPSYVRDADGGLWRAARWIEDARNLTEAPTSQQTIEAARAYGAFARALNSPAEAAPPYAVVLEGFHDLAYRRHQFEQACRDNSAGRVNRVAKEIERAHALLDSSLQRVILGSGALPWRTTHNDSKLDNLLFDVEGNRVLAVVDLDTIMPGSPVVDFGDLVRSVCSSHAEDAPSADLTLNEPRFKQLVEGYIAGWQGQLLRSEHDRLADGAAYVTTLVATRFLTDYLSGDRYFSVAHAEHNLDRARNQLRLAEQIAVRLPQLRGMIRDATRLR